MEIEKSKEKAKRSKQDDYVSIKFPMILVFLSLIFSLLPTYLVLPIPIFFFYSSVALGFILVASAFFLVTRKKYFFLVWIGLSIPIILLFTSMFFLTLIFVGMATISFYLRSIPAFIFPLSAFVLLIFLKSRQRTFPHLHRSEQSGKIWFVFISMLVLGIYFWAYGIDTLRSYYDKGLEVKGKNYHVILVDLAPFEFWDAGRDVYLYECQLGIFFCHVIYYAPIYCPNYCDTKLIYNEAEHVLHLTEYEVFYEHPIP
jgi:hypothetical protein